VPARKPGAPDAARPPPRAALPRACGAGCVVTGDCAITAGHSDFRRCNSQRRGTGRVQWTITPRFCRLSAPQAPEVRGKAAQGERAEGSEAALPGACGAGRVVMGDCAITAGHSDFRRCNSQRRGTGRVQWTITPRFCRLSAPQAPEVRGKAAQGERVEGSEALKPWVPNAMDASPERAMQPAPAFQAQSFACYAAWICASFKISPCNPTTTYRIGTLRRARFAASTTWCSSPPQQGTCIMRTVMDLTSA